MALLFNSLLDGSVLCGKAATKANPAKEELRRWNHVLLLCARILSEDEVDEESKDGETASDEPSDTEPVKGKTLKKTASQPVVLKQEPESNKDDASSDEDEIPIRWVSIYLLSFFKQNFKILKFLVKGVASQLQNLLLYKKRWSRKNY